jgi:hypothetical protein
MKWHPNIKTMKIPNATSLLTPKAGRIKMRSIGTTQPIIIQAIWFFMMFAFVVFLDPDSLLPRSLMIRVIH